jgi:hypothetical protein
MPRRPLCERAMTAAERLRRKAARKRIEAGASKPCANTVGHSRPDPASGKLSPCRSASQANRCEPRLSRGERFGRQRRPGHEWPVVPASA